MKIKGYNILEVLSRSSELTVAVAHQRSLNRKVVLKVLRIPESQGQDILDQFHLEAQALAHLNDPNIVTVHELSTAGENPYIVMEYFPGENLRQVKRGKNIPYTQLISIMDQSLRACEKAHAAGILHRDLKPENLLISAEGVVKITDFGFASLVGSFPTLPALVGSPGYLAPELALGDPPSEQTDIFALGMTFYELAVGENPLRSDNLNDSLNLAVSETPPPLSDYRKDIPDDLSRIIERMIHKSLSDRYRTCKKVREDLTAFIADEKASATPYMNSAKVPEKPVNPVKRVTVYGLGIAILAILMIYGNRESWFGEPIPETNDPDATRMVRDTEGTGYEDQQNDEYITGLRTPAEGAESGTEPVSNINLERGNPATEALNTPTDPDNGTETGTTVYIAANPWAEIYIDDQFVGTTPLQQQVTLNSGRREILFRHPDYPDYRQKITVKDGKSDSIFFHWKEAFGYLAVSVNPWAEVYIDNQFIDITPLTNYVPVRPGSHHLFLKNPDFPIWQQSVNVDANDTLVLKIQL